MNKPQARTLIQETFTKAFDKNQFRRFTQNLVNHLDESKAGLMAVPDAFKSHVRSCWRLGTYKSPLNELIDVLVVGVTESHKLERTRTGLRDFVAHKLKRGDNYKEAGLVAFVSPDQSTWRFSYVRMDYESQRDPKTGKIVPEERLTPARRFSYLVGEGENCHTAQTRFLDLLQETDTDPPLAEIEKAFSVQAVTDEFFVEYAGLFEEVHKGLERLASKDKLIREEFRKKNINSVDFAKKLLGQVVFLYFLQKKGWLGVAEGGEWGSGSRDFLRRLANGDYGKYNNFFNDILEHLFYDTLATDRGHDAWCSRFKCRIPFLNGGLFEPLGAYDWQGSDINLPNRLFTNADYVDEGITGTGVLDVFDRYNFTVNEAEPLEKEVAIDPEMLGKVFENLIEDNRRKGLGAYYTPREIVHHMCLESLINYLDTALNTKQKSLIPTRARQGKLIAEPEPEQSALPQTTYDETVSRADIETLIHSGEQISHYESVDAKYRFKMPPSIEKHARSIDEKLADITICDPAVGSGAFPVGMMTEIVRARAALTPYFSDLAERTPYHFKRHAIQKSLYGVDIDAGAVEIAKLRLWLSLVVDEEDVKEIKPLPNLDYKIVWGNSLVGVDKDLFNNELFVELERLKPLYFNESNPAKKHKYKQQIDESLRQLTNGRKDFDFEIYFSELFHDNRGFDVVIANPPYIGEKGNEEIFHKVAKTQLGKKHYSRWMDYFYYFFHRSIDIGKQGSNIAFITTNYYLTATGAKNLRTDIKQRTVVKQLSSFNELKIFESAKGQHNMLTLLQKARDINAPAHNLTTDRQGMSTPEVLASIFRGNDPETHYYTVRQAELYEGIDFQMRLAGQGDDSNTTIESVLAKMKSKTCRLGDLCHILMGLVSRADKVSQDHFKKDPALRATKGDGIFVLTPEELSRLQLSKGDVTKYVRPFYKNSNIAKYYCRSKNKLWLLYMKDEGRPIILSKEMKSHFSKYGKSLDEIEKKFPKKRNRFRICEEVASVVRQTDHNLLLAARARFTFSRMSEALAVQTNGFGSVLCWAM